MLEVVTLMEKSSSSVSIQYVCYIIKLVRRLIKCRLKLMSIYTTRKIPTFGVDRKLKDKISCIITLL